MLAEVEPRRLLTFTAGRVVLVEDYDKLKAIAVELAKCCEIINERAKQYTKCNTSTEMYTNEVLTTARKMLGDVAVDL